MSLLYLIVIALAVASSTADPVVSRCGRLPGTRRSDTVSVYDGIESVYIVGGEERYIPGKPSHLLSEVLRFNVNTGTLELVGHVSAALSAGLGIFHQQSRAIYYFGGLSQLKDEESHSFNRLIYKYGVDDGKTEVIDPRFYDSIIKGNIAYDGDDNVYIVTGFMVPISKIYLYQISTGIMTEVHNFGFQFTGPAATWSPIQKSVLVFGGRHDMFYPTKTIYQFQPIQKSFSVYPVELLVEFAEGQVVHVPEEDSVYVLGGSRHFNETDIGLSKISLARKTITRISDSDIFKNRVAFSAAYASKQKRIVAVGAFETGSIDIDCVQL